MIHGELLLQRQHMWEEVLWPLRRWLYFLVACWGW